MPRRKRWFVCCTDGESNSDAHDLPKYEYRQSSHSAHNAGDDEYSSKTSPYDDVMYDDYEENVSHSSHDYFEQGYGMNKATASDDGYGFVEASQDVESNVIRTAKAPAKTTWFGKKNITHDFDPSGRGNKPSSRPKQRGGKSKAILRQDLRKGNHSKQNASQPSPRTKRRAQRAITTEHEPAPPGSVVCVRGHLVVFEEQTILKQKRTCDCCSDKSPTYKCQGRCDFHMCEACYVVSQKTGRREICNLHRVDSDCREESGGGGREGGGD